MILFGIEKWAIAYLQGNLNDLYHRLFAKPLIVHGQLTIKIVQLNIMACNKIEMDNYRNSNGQIKRCFFVYKMTLIALDMNRV